jgi:hypothetical protein
MTIPEQEAVQITQDLDVPTAIPDRADLLMVFGTRHPEPAHLASALFKYGIMPEGR